MNNLRIIFSENSFYFEVDVPSKDKIRHKNLARIVRKHGGIYKWMEFNRKHHVYNQTDIVRFYKLNHTSARIPKKDFDRQVKNIQNIITSFSDGLIRK